LIYGFLRNKIQAKTVRREKKHLKALRLLGGWMGKPTLTNPKQRDRKEDSKIWRSHNTIRATGP
jgi:uncharacterized membrane protein YsdA (DUF1294 family)